MGGERNQTGVPLRWHLKPGGSPLMSFLSVCPVFSTRHPTASTDVARSQLCEKSRRKTHKTTSKASPSRWPPPASQGPRPRDSLLLHERGLTGGGQRGGAGGSSGLRPPPDDSAEGGWPRSQAFAAHCPSRCVSWLGGRAWGAALHPGGKRNGCLQHSRAHPESSGGESREGGQRRQGD
uniref:Uncharacterized protein n=1 Tax=Myotis myotis TaxID=51298 RepID=A0A7J7ZWF8_MYOMY|nr:hypothetical protein mMyoMyo1_009569 [Myotis myotis]